MGGLVGWIGWSDGRAGRMDGLVGWIGWSDGRAGRMAGWLARLRL